MDLRRSRFSIKLVSFSFCLLFSITTQAYQCTVSTGSTTNDAGSFPCTGVGSSPATSPTYVEMWNVGKCNYPNVMVGFNQPSSGECQIVCAPIIVKCQ